MQNKVSLFSLLTISSLLLCSCKFNAPSPEEEQGILEEAGYTVVLNPTSDDSESPLFWVTGTTDTLYANKDKDEIYLFYFASIDEASYNSDFLNFPEYYSGQINELLYLGTKQAVKDAKL